MLYLFLLILAASVAARFTIWRKDQPWQWTWLARPLTFGAVPFSLLSLAEKNPTLPSLNEIGGGVVAAWAVGLLLILGAEYLGLGRLLSLLGLGGEKSKDQTRRGVKILSDKEVARMIKKAGHKTHAQLGCVPIPVNVEPLHFLMAGAPGSGKSLAFYQMLASARKRQHRAIISDPGAEFLKRFWMKGDVIFNPFDERGVDWSPFAEMRQPYDAESIAASMIPEGHGSAAEWNGYARTILETVLERLFERDNPTNADLVYYLTTAPLQELKELVDGSPAQRYFSKLDSGMLASVLNIVVSYIKPYSYLNPTAGKNSFSVRKWIEEDGENWLFLSFRNDQLKAIRPMLAAVLDVAASAVGSLPEDRDRRIFFALDEFPAIGQIESIHPLLSMCRKKGAVVILGIQAISQLYATYGREMAQTILSCVGTWLVFKQPDADTADYMSKCVGDEEMRRVVESGNQQGGGWQEQIQRQRAVIPSELQNLNPRVGILNIAGAIPPCWTTIPITNLPDRTETFQDRDMRAARISKPTPASDGAAAQERRPEATPEPETAAPAAEIQGDDPFADLIK